jgi:small subunit ribosomal protein S8
VKKGNMSTDPIADMLTTIRNGYLTKTRKVLVPRSKFKEEIVKTLIEAGYLENYKINEGRLEINLKYKNRKPVLEQIKRVSKPGLRIYKPNKKIGRIRSGFGISIISTPKGVMTSQDAKKKGLGGEIICLVW